MKRNSLYNKLIRQSFQPTLNRCRKFPVLVPLFLLILVCPAFGQGQVWTVDINNGPGTDFTSVIDAVNSAASDDVLLIRAGTYTGGTVIIDGKSLVLSADSGAKVVLDGLYFKVWNLAADQSVTFRGLASSIYTPVLVTRFQFNNNAGPIWMEDCTLYGGNHGGLQALVQVISCDQVVIERSTLWGLRADIGGFDPVPGLEMWDSSVYLHDCHVQGGTGIASHGFYMTFGSRAAVVHGGRLYASGGEFIGGNAGNYVSGHGVHLWDGDPAYYHVNVTHEPGMGGFGLPTGDPIKVDSGFESALSFPYHGFEVTSPHRSGEQMIFSMEGAPGEVVLILLNLEPSTNFFLEYGGPLLVAPPFHWMAAVGTLPPDGLMNFSTTVPAFPGMNALTLYFQPAFLPAGFPPALGPGSFALFLDPSL